MAVKTATTASVFSAALGSMLLSPELQADSVSLSFTPGSVAYGGNAYVVIDQLGVSFNMWNTAAGQQLSILGGGISSVLPAQLSQSF